MKKKSKNLRQGGRWKTVRLLAFILLLLIGSVLIMGTLLGGRFGVPHRFTLEFLGPVQSGVTVISSSVTGVYKNYLDLLGVRAENRRLQALVEKYLKELEEYREGYTNYLSLQTQLDFKKTLEFEPIAGRVVGKGGGNWYQTIVVDRGRSDDVLEGMIAFAPEGVVGQVIQVSENYCKVLLADAPSSAIDAIVQKNRVRGILKGNGRKGYTLEYVLKNDDVVVGDNIVTAGIGGVFPRGMFLGKVAEVHKKRRGMFLEIEVTPGVDFQNLEYVFIDPTDRRKIVEFIDESGQR